MTASTETTRGSAARPLVGIALASSLLLAACGGGTTSAPVASPSATTSPAPTPLSTQDDSADRTEAAGLSFVLPPDHVWVPDVTDTARFVVNLEGSFATSIAVEVLPLTIDGWLADQEAFYADEGYEVPDEWWYEVQVPGAVRAVDVDWISGSGDLALTVRLVEVDGQAVMVEVARYIEDLELLSPDEVGAFFASVRVDAAATGS